MYKTTILILNVLILRAFSFDIREVNVKIDYNKTKAIVQNCLNGLLNLLNVEVPTSRKPKLRLLVVIQNNLNNIVHYKWKVHSEMQFIAKAESVDTPLMLYEYVEAAITDIEKDIPSNKTIITNKINTNDSSHFFAEIFNAINNQNVTSLDDVCVRDNNITSIDNQEININWRRMDDDLEIWGQNEDEENHTRRVFGGRPVAITQYPFVVSIHVLGKFKGTGCIIHKNFIITAASCLQPRTMNRGEQNPVHVRIRSEQTSDGGYILPAVAVVFHPKYDPVSLENNLAIVKVENILQTVKKPLIKKIRISSLPENIPKSFASKGVFVLGWRIYPEDTARTNRLSSAFLDITSLDECMAIYTTHLVKAKHFCAGLVYKGTGACNGDIGSPAIVSGNLVGLVNFGPPSCGTMSSPTVFTKLVYYTSWIREVLNDDAQKVNYKTEPIFNFEKSNNEFSVSKESPEEILILRQLVHEIDKPNNTIHQLIEEDEEIEEEMNVLFQTTSKTVVDAAHHSLELGIQEENYITKIGAYHRPEVTPYVTRPVFDIDLPINLPYNQIDHAVKNNNELRNAVQDLLSQGTESESIPNEVKKYLELMVLRTRTMPKKREKKSVESDSNDNFEYETDEGMSIELKKTGNDRRDTSQETQSSKESVSEEQGIVLDLGNHDFQLKMRSEKKIPDNLRPDIWSEVMRLSKLKQIQLGKDNAENGHVKLNKAKPKRFQSILVPKHPPV